MASESDKTVIESVAAQTSGPAGLTLTTAIKAGWRSTEFWVVVGTIVAAVGDAVMKYRSEVVEPTSWGIVAAGLAAGFYALARAIVKATVPTKP